MKNQIKTIIAAAAFLIFLLLISVGYKTLSGYYNKKTAVSSSPASSSAVTAEDQNRPTADDFAVEDINGKTVKLSSFTGKPVVINFWASWCPPCRGEMPDYENLYQKYSKKGVEFMMINLTDGERETKETAMKFIKENHYSFPVFFDTTGNASVAYAISAIPDSFFIDKKGKIADLYEGAIDAGKMKASIEKIMK